MSDPVNEYWNLRLADVKEALEANNFKVDIVASAGDAARLFMQEILPATGASTVSFGGSKTLLTTGIPDMVRSREGIEVIDTYDTTITREQVLERRRLSLHADLFISGSNALTADGKLVNLDMIGNRTGAIHFGPRHVVLFVGRNKLVDSVDEGMRRIKEYAAPVNAMRLQKKTPCVKTGMCMDCKSPDRICNVWTVTEKSFPAGRIHVVLINEDLGF